MIKLYKLYIWKEKSRNLKNGQGVNLEDTEGMKRPHQGSS